MLSWSRGSVLGWGRMMYSAVAWPGEVLILGWGLHCALEGWAYVEATLGWVTQGCGLSLWLCWA